jgi:hypothetical protein
MVLKARVLGNHVLSCRSFLNHWIDACTDTIHRQFPLPPEHPEVPRGFDPSVAESLYRPWDRDEYALTCEQMEEAGCDEDPPEAPVALFRVTPDMADHVDGYVELCMSELERLNEAPGPPAEVMVERRMDMSWLHPKLGGTADFIAAKFLDELVVVDLKFGKGVMVEVEANEQELTYVVGAVHETGFDGTRVSLWIAQPRKEHDDGPFRRWECTMDEVRAHQHRLRERALETERPDAPLAPGEWCKFCPVAGSCPALADRAMLEAQLDFSAVGTPEVSDVQEMGDAELARAGRALKVVEAWCKAVGARLLERAMDRSPEVLREFKVVRKRSTRRYLLRDQAEALAAIRGALTEQLGWTDCPIPEEAFLQPRRVLSPRQVELMKLPAGVKRGDIKAAVASVVHLPPGGLTLAPRDDPRDEVDPSDAGTADFEAIEDSNGEE